MGKQYSTQKLQDAAGKLERARTRVTPNSTAPSETDQAKLYKNICQTMRTIYSLAKGKRNLLNKKLSEVISQAQNLVDDLDNNRFNKKIDPHSEQNFFNHISEIENISKEASSTPSP